MISDSMPLVPFGDMMRDAARERYAVGYFESWNLESLLAAADAAQALQSPVLLGFSGIYLPHPQRRTQEYLRDYVALANSVATRLTVPACVVFNESPHRAWVDEAIALGFGLVMYAEDAPASPDLLLYLAALVERAHRAGVAVEAEMQSLPGVGGELMHVPDEMPLTNPSDASAFVEQTRIDALAVNVGQVHLHGRTHVRLDLERLEAIRRATATPLVLHGATSVSPDDLAQAIQMGVQKVNIGSALKRVYFEALREACGKVGQTFNPYDVMGSGLDADVLTSARLALQTHVQEWIGLLGSAGKG